METVLAILWNINFSHWFNTLFNFDAYFSSMVNAICCFNTLYMHGYANQNWKMDCCRSAENMHGGVVRVNTYLWDKSAYELILYKLGRQNWTMHHWKTNYEVHIFAETYCRFILAFNIYSQKTKKVSRFAKHTSAFLWWSILRVN